MSPTGGFAGVLGWPLTFTLSPAIHNAALRIRGIDWVYLAFPVPPARLSDAVAGLRALGAMGASVTMPHKEIVLEHLDDLSGDARAIGSVNTIQRVGDRLIGHNTDVDGFAEFLQGDAGLDVAGRTVTILGAGGAARAVVRAVSDLGAVEITIAARDEIKAGSLAPLAGAGRFRAVGVGGIPDACSDSDLIVNCTPLGMDGEDAAPGAAFAAGQAVVDLVYWPPQTPLLARARAGGAQAWGGLGMLVRQAAASFTIWTGQDPPLETMSAVALHALRARAKQSQ
ncbi:MAG: shikimate dehydrogenase [Actinobacteria bacterium]|nr:shikimate dehydrogenase [Actinomycetota bacterium]